MNKISKLTILSLLSFLWLNLSAGTRIAIVSENSQKLSDLLTVELSSVDGVELLDRSEIRKILKEHKIAAQMVDSKQALKLNKLLKTDLFVVLESEQKSNKPIGLVVFDANTGVRYWDSALPEGDIEKTANFTTDAVKKALGKKDKAESGKLKYISLLAVRNTDLPREKDPFCKAVGILLMRQLGNSEDIVVLERSYLDWLNKERSLPGMNWADKLIASNSILALELYRSRGPKGHNVKAALLIPRKQGLTVTGLLERPAKIAESLAVKFAERIKIRSLENTNFNSSLEAKRFYNEAKLLHHHKKYPQACEKMEAAYALDMDNYEYCQALSFYLADVASFLVNPKYEGKNISYHCPRRISVNPEILYRALALMDRSLDYKLSMLNSIESIEDKNKRVKKMVELLGWRKMKLFFQEVSEATKGHNEKTEILLKECQGKALKCFKTQYEAYLDNTVSKNSYLHYHLWIDPNYGDVRFFSSNGKIALTELIEIADDRLSLAQKFGHKGNFYATLESIFDSLREAWELAPWELGKKEIDLVTGFFSRLQSSEMPDVKLFGEKGLLWVKTLEKNISEKRKEDIILAYCNKMMEQISSLPPKTDSTHILNSYLIILKSQREDLPYEIRRKSIVELFRFMEKQKHFVIDIACVAAMECTASTEHNSEALELISDSYALLEAGDTRILKYAKNNFNSNMTRLKKSIYSKNKNLIPKDKRIKPWLEEKQLFQVNNKDWIYRITDPVKDKDKLFFCIGGIDKKNKKPYVQPVMISVPEGKTNLGTKAPLKWETRKFYRLGKSNRNYGFPMANAACVSEGTYYLATCNSGVYIFHKNGKVEIINKEKGLPSNNIQSIAVMNDRLYLGLGTLKKDSYLLVYDLKGKTFELLASSQRKQKTSPFDDSQPTRFPWMMADPEKNRILLYAVKGNRNRSTGLWSIDISDYKMKQLIQANSSCEYACLSENNNLIISNSFSTFTYDLNTGKTKLLNSNHKASPFPKRSFKKSGAGSFRDIGPKLLLDDWLWSADYFARISPDRKTQEVFNFHSEQGLFQPKEFIGAYKIDDQQYVITASQHAIWMFKMPKGKSK